MKKKIRDLTLDDCEKVCFKQKQCDKCPLVFSKKSTIHCLFIAIKCGYKPQGNLEREVEIDD